VRPNNGSSGSSVRGDVSYSSDNCR
jgi:hypothetical protein